MKKHLAAITFLLASCGVMHDPHNPKLENNRIVEGRTPERNVRQEDNRREIPETIPPFAKSTVMTLTGPEHVMISYERRNWGMHAVDFAIRNSGGPTSSSRFPVNRLSRNDNGFVQMGMTPEPIEFWMYHGPLAADNPSDMPWSFNNLLHGNRVTPGNSLAGFITDEQNVANTLDELNALFDGALDDSYRMRYVRRLRAQTTHTIVLSQSGVGTVAEDQLVRLQFSDFGYWRQETRITYAGRSEYLFARVEPFFGGLGGHGINVSDRNSGDPMTFTGTAIGILRTVPTDYIEDRISLTGPSSDVEMVGRATLTFTPTTAGAGREQLSLNFTGIGDIVFANNNSVSVPGLTGATGGFTTSYWGRSGNLSEAVGSFFYTGTSGGNRISMTGAFGTRLP